MLKRYEEKVDLYLFYNAKTQKMWTTDYSVGSVVAMLSGDLTCSEIIDILSENNKNIPKSNIEDVFTEVFDVLRKGEFIVECS